MNFYELKAFVVLSKQLHFAKTAEEINISPSALSRIITRLEEETGDVVQKPVKNRGAPGHIKDWNEFQVFVRSLKFQNISDLVPIFEQRFGYAVSYAVLVRAIHVLGMRRRRGRFYS